MRRFFATRTAVAIAVLLALAACAGQRLVEREPELTRDDLFDPGGELFAFSYSEPRWNFIGGRLFSVMAHTFGGRIFGEERSLATLRVKNNLRFPQRMTFWLDMKPYARDAIKEVELAPGEQRTIRLSPNFDYERLYALRSPTPVQVALGWENALTGGTRVFDATTVLEPVTRLQWKVPAVDGQRGWDLRPYAIMLVTPDDRTGEVQKLVREAARYTSIGRFRGYDNATLDEVTDQVAAIYQALQARGFIYNSVASTYFDHVQRVRLPAESLQQNHGNCIDTTLVFASAFEAIGLEPQLIFLTGHAFVGVDKTPAEKNTAKKPQMVLVETTLVSDRPFVEAMNRGAEIWKQAKQAGDENLVMLDVRKGRRGGMYPVNF